MSRYDAIVIGSGQAGNPLSQKLADRGWTVALVEQDHLGGTCINTGCTPTKTMVASAQVAHYARNAARLGRRSRGGAAWICPRSSPARTGSSSQFRAGQRAEGREADRTCTSTAGTPASSARTRSASATRSSRASASSSTPARGRQSRRSRPGRRRLPDQRQHHGADRGAGAPAGPRRRLHRPGVRADVPPLRQPRDGRPARRQLLPREDADVAEELQQALESEGIRFRPGCRRATRVEKAARRRSP